MVAQVGDWTWSGWRVVGRSEQGRVRSRQEDAWKVLTPRPGLDKLTVAVFDGLGGEPRGREASQAASAALDQAVNAASRPVEILDLLAVPVTASRGFTTAVVAQLYATGRVEFAGIGDSSGFVWVAGELVPMLKHDRAPGGALTAFLGGPPIRGHGATAELNNGEAVLLCTDGVDNALTPAELSSLVAQARADPVRAVSRIFERIDERGAQDNATLILAIRSR